MTKYIKKIIASILTLAMTLSMLTVTNVEAATAPLSFSAANTYAIISDVTNKPVYVHNIGWGDKDTMADGEYTSSMKIAPESVMKITPLDDQSGVDSSNGEVKVKIEYKRNDGELYPMRSEGNNYIFADPDDNRRNDKVTGEVLKLCSYIIIKTGNSKAIIKDVTRGYYLSVNDKGEIRKLSDDKDDATEFTFVENPQIINKEVYIESKSTGKLVTFKDQNDDDYAPIKVTGDKNNITIDEKFTANYVVNTNGIKDVVAFKSLSKTGYQIGSAKWVDGAVPMVGSTTGTGGWESIAVEPLGNGEFALRDAAKGTYVVVNEDDVLEPGHEKLDPLPDNYRFIIHNEMDILEVEDLTYVNSSRTRTSIELKWTNPLSLYTDIELYKKASNEALFTKIANFTDENKYTVEGLSEGTEYEFYLKYISGNGDLNLTTNPIYTTETIKAKTRVGEKPTTVSNVSLEENGNQVVIRFDRAQNATHYRILGAKSMFGNYQKVAVTTNNVATVNLIDSTNKYNNYYKVVALNNGNNGDVDFSDAELGEESEYVSIETNMFGRNTFIFSPEDDVAKVDELLLKLFEQQNDYDNDAQFKGKQYQVYFKKGDYTETSCMYLGFYTSFSGLGKLPTDVKLNNIAIPAYLPNGALNAGENNATCNFWRSTENLSVINTGNEQGKVQYGSCRPEYFNWAVAQAAPLRRIYSTRPVAYDWNYGWASGGYVADSWIDAIEYDGSGNPISAGTFSGQQFYTRNSKLQTNAYGCTLNNFFQGVEANNLPNSTTGDALLSGEGYSNWNIPGDNGDQQIYTNIEKTKELAEKPFLYIDDDGEYKVFVPSVQKNTKGISWGDGKANNGMGTGKSISLSDFYIAKPTDSASKINEALEAGKNIYFTPGTYHAEEVIHVSNDDTILLGSGMASIIPDNDEAAVVVDDNVDGVRIAGLIFDAGSHSEYLLKIGNTANGRNASNNPIILQDLFFRVGGTTNALTKADNAIVINSDNVLCDHFWIWRADHGTGVAWDGNVSNHGLIVNGDNVTCYGLFNEHFNKYDTLWNGENGSTYFYQNEKCYDPVSQELWMSHNGSVNGYAAYKVANNVRKHYAVGLGIYNVFIYTGGTLGQNGNPGTLGDGKTVSIQMDNAIEVPNSEDVIIENACLQTFANADGALQKFNHIINGVGNGVSSGVDNQTGIIGEDWSRQFLISYKNGTAKVGKKNSSSEKGKYVGIDVINNIKQLGEDDLDLDELKELSNSKKDSNLYTKESYDKYLAAYNASIELLSVNLLKYATQDQIDDQADKLDKAIKQLKLKETDNDNQTGNNQSNGGNQTGGNQTGNNQSNGGNQTGGNQSNSGNQTGGNQTGGNQSNSGNQTGGNQTGNNQSNGGNQSSNKTNTNKTNTNKVKTGDDTSYMLYVLLAMLAMGALYALQKSGKTKKAFVALMGASLILTPSFVEAAENPYDTWKTNALVSPQAGKLLPAGYIDVEWNKLDNDKVVNYKVYLDNELKETVNNETTKTKVYTTVVGKHTTKVVAILDNQDEVNVSERTFFVSKKGLGFYTESDTNSLKYAKNMGLSWYYNWGETPFNEENVPNNDIEYVPMIWNNQGSVEERLNQLEDAGYETVLSFNEPDRTDQANMSVELASSYNSTFHNTNLRVGSPAVSNNMINDDWFDNYWNSISQKDDFVTIHSYPGYVGLENNNEYTPKMAAKNFLDYVKAVYEKYRKPIWITEFAVASFDNNFLVYDGTNEQHNEAVKQFMSYVINGVDDYVGLDALSYVERYAWFSFACNNVNGGSSGLFYNEEDTTRAIRGELTALGINYRNSGNPIGYAIPSLEGIANPSNLIADNYIVDNLTSDNQTNDDQTNDNQTNDNQTNDDKDQQLGGNKVEDQEVKDDKSNNQIVNKENKHQAVKTGDDSFFSLYLFSLLMSLMGLFVLKESTN